MSSEISPEAGNLIYRLVGELKTNARDEHSRYAETTVPGGDESDILDVLVQTAESTSTFALWYGEGMPGSCDDDGFAAVAECVRSPDGSIIAWYEEVRADENEEPYERVRILVAFRSDGLVVTLNRYAEAGPTEPADPWEFASLQALALAPTWRRGRLISPCPANRTSCPSQREQARSVARPVGGKVGQRAGT